MGEDIAQEIIGLEKAALARWCGGDPSGFLELSAPDVVYFDPFQPGRVDGLAALTQLYESLRGQVSAEGFELINPCVQVVGEAAVLTFNFRSWDRSGATYRWNCTEVYRRQPDGWRIIQTHWSWTKPAVSG